MSGQRTVKCRTVSEQLRKYRELAGLTVTEAAERLGLSQGQVSRLELGSRGLKVPDVAAMLGLYGVPQSKQDELLELVREATVPGWSASSSAALPPGWTTLIAWERRATSISECQLSVVPDLLQTPDYARAVLAATHWAELPADRLDVLVSARLGRQGVLGRETPPRLDILVFEPVLRIPVGGPAVMRRQLLHMVDAMERPEVCVRVIPMGAGPHPGIVSPFVILDFAGTTAVVHTPNRTGEEDAERYRMAFRRAWPLALSPEESAEFVAKAAVEFG